MGPFHWLLLLFVLAPLAEIYLLIQVGSQIGALSTIALCLLTAAIGATLVRAQGFSTLARVQASLERRELPAVAIVEAAVLLFAGVLLLTPGLLTDALGFACLVPPLRRAVILKLLEKHIVRAQQQRRGPGPGGPGDPGPRVIEGEFRREDP